MLSSLKNTLTGRGYASSSSQRKEQYAVLRNDVSSSDDSDQENTDDEQQNHDTSIDNNIEEATRIIPATVTTGLYLDLYSDIFFNNIYFL